MFRVFMNFILALRTKFQSMGGGVFEKFRDPSGKFKFLSPKSLKLFIYTVGAIFFITMVVVNFFSPANKMAGGYESYQKDMKPSAGVSNDTDVFNNGNNSGTLEFSTGLKNNKDPLADLLKDEKGGGKDPTKVAELTATDCLNINDKLKNNTKLTEVETVQANECLEKNLASMSESEREAMKRLLDPNISEEEKKLIRKKLNSELDPGSAEDKIASQILDGNPDAAQCAEAYKARDKKAMEICAKKLDGEDLSPEEKAALKKYEDAAKIAEAAKAKGEVPASTATDGAPKTISTSVPGGLNKEEAAKVLAQEIAKSEQDKKDLENKLKVAEKAAQEAARKIQAGQAASLTDAEQKALAQISDLNKQNEILKQMQEQRKQEFAKLYKELSQSMMQIEATMKETYPSGISVELADLPNCRTVKGLYKKPKAPVITKKITDKEIYLDSNGKAITPDKIRYVQLLRQKQFELERIKKDIRNPLGDQTTGKNVGYAGERMATNGAAQQKEFNITELSVFNDKALKSFSFTSDMKIPAILDSEILISSKSKGQQVRLKIVADIHDPSSGKLIIPKGSIATAMAQGFDEDTGVMDISINKVSIGSGKTIDVTMSLGSADGTMGLKGQVRDTRGKYLAGAFVTAFSAGALNWFSQQIVQPYTTSTVASEALTGASLSGGGEVMTKIAEMYAQDLQNAPKIFWCPKKVPVILFPQ